MCPRKTVHSEGCPLSLGRRKFLALAGTSALSGYLGLLGLPNTLAARPDNGGSKPRLRAVFVRPDDKKYWMSWPGASYDPEASQAEYTKTLTKAAGELGVDLEIRPLPLHDAESIEREAQLLRENPPAGLIVTVMHLESWPRVQYLLKERGGFPAVVFSPLGTGLADSMRSMREIPKTFVGATPDHQWLGSALRQLKTAWELQHTRICMVSDVIQGDHPAGKLGTTLHYVPLSRWVQQFQATETTKAMREIAKHYGIEARDIVEPEMEDLLDAARNYVVACQIMADENCQGISVDCAQLVGEHHSSCGPCLAWSKLLDEGRVGACEGDADAAVSLLLAMRLFDRPGFMQDAAPNTVNNTLVASHCTCATRLKGYDKDPAPYRLRSHYESNTGVAMQVLWPKDQELTLFKFQRPNTLLFGTGRVRDNVQVAFAGGCRTAVEIEVDEVADASDVKGHHQVLVCGRFDQELKAFCQLSDLEAVHV